VVLLACATVRGVLALRRVSFDLDRAADVRLAGVPLDDVRSFSSLDLRDGARLAAAVARGEVPLAFNLWVRGETPADNRVTARLVRMSWTLLRAVPVLDTPLGAIRYPEPITIVRRTVGGP